MHRRIRHWWPWGHELLWGFIRAQFLVLVSCSFLGIAGVLMQLDGLGVFERFGIAKSIVSVMIDAFGIAGFSGTIPVATVMFVEWPSLLIPPRLRKGRMSQRLLELGRASDPGTAK
jgi:hypothetical protein